MKHPVVSKSSKSVIEWNHLPPCHVAAAATGTGSQLPLLLTNHSASKEVEAEDDAAALIAGQRRRLKMAASRD